MPVYRIAALDIKIDPIYEMTKTALEPYLTDGEAYDFEVTAREDGFNSFCKESYFPNNLAFNEGPYLYTQICKKVLSDYNGFFFHSSSLAIDGEGYLFTAASGTGKSTHTGNWRKLFGDRVTMINDDKPLIRKIDGKYYVCGTPWMGKSNIGCNMSVPVKAVYVLRRGEENRAEKTSPGTVFNHLLEATLIPKTRENMTKLLEMFNELFSQADLFLLSCNKDVDSARVAYEAAQKKCED